MKSPVALAAGDFLMPAVPLMRKRRKRMEQYTTQMDAARRGIVTKELEIVAKIARKSRAYYRRAYRR